MPVFRASSYAGPACPRCGHPVELRELTDGPVSCPHCGGEFEARVFHPPTRHARVLQLAQSGPEAAGACANHPRNAAVTTCDHCGIFICSLCEMNVDGGRYCPTCFERLAAEGTLQSARMRFRAYGSLAGLTALAGLFFSGFFLGLPLGILSLYYVVRGFRTRRESGASILGLIIATLLALVDILISGIMIVSIIKVMGAKK